MNLLCEAAAMDAAAALAGKDVESLKTGPHVGVVPCDQPASVECHGFSLCSGCAEALMRLVSIGAAARRARQAGTQGRDA